MKILYVLISLFMLCFGCNTPRQNEKKLMLKADSFMLVNQPDSAFTIWQELKSADDVDIIIESQIKIAQLYILSLEYPIALKLFLELYETTNIDSLTEKIGLCYYKTNNIDSALYFFDKSINYDNKISYCYLGICHDELNNIDSAKHYYKLAIKKNQLKYIAYNNLGAILFDNNDYDSAIYCYNKSIESNASFSQAYFNLAVCYLDLKRAPESLIMINKSIEIDPNNSLYLYKKAIIYHYLNRADSTCVYLKKSSDLGYIKAHETFNRICK